MSDNDVLRKKKHFGMETLQDVLDRQKGLCPYCGFPVKLETRRGNYWSLDHVIPYCIYKWSEYALPEEESERVYDMLNSVDNVVVAHHKCNMDKNSSMPSRASIIKMKLPNNMKANILSLMMIAHPYIDEHIKLMQRVYEKQNGVCYRCHKNIDLLDGTIRRVDLDKPRIEDNACIICPSCNEVLGHNRFGHKRIVIGHI